VTEVNISKSLLKRLELMRIVSRSIFGGNPTGERRSIYRGVGVEFADHRQYTPGDDFRYIDWNILARTNQIYIKLFDRQESVPLYMLVDCSDSMRAGGAGKLDRAKEIAAGLSYVGLFDGDMVRIALFTDTLVGQSEQFTHRREMFKVVDFLSQADPGGGQTDFGEAMPFFAKRTSRRGIVFIISDFLDPNGITEGVQSLLYRKFHVCGIHTVTRAELAPEATGEFVFVDSETRRAREVRIRKGTLEQYKQMFERHRRGVEKLFRFYGGDYVLVKTEDKLDDILTKLFRHAGILQ